MMCGQSDVHRTMSQPVTDQLAFPYLSTTVEKEGARHHQPPIVVVLPESRLVLNNHIKKDFSQHVICAVVHQHKL